MKKKNRHIDKYLHDRLPEPEIQADEAWTHMSDMLKTVPTGNSHSAAGKMAGKIVSLKWPLMIITGVVTTSLAVVFAITDPGSETIKQEAKSNVHAPIPENKLTVEPKSKEIQPITKDIVDEESEEKEFDAAFKKVNPATIHEASNISGTLKTDAKSTVAPLRTSDLRAYGSASSSHEKVKSNTLKKTTKNRPPRQNHRIAYSNVTRNSRGNSRGNFPADPVASSSGRRNAFHSSFDDKKLVGNESPKQLPILNLTPRGFKAKTYRSDLAKRIENPRKPVATVPREVEKNRTSALHFGLEWSINSSLQSTDYMLTGADSTSRPARLLIPGIFVSKNWQNHGLTFSFAPYQSYFGNNKIIQHQADSTSVPDSLKSYQNTRFQKAVGMNFNLQYQYRVLGFLSLSAGASYSPFSKALLRKEMENRFGNILQGPLVTAKKSGDMGSYVNPTLFAVKAGILFHPGRFQAGFNVILPLTNVSASSESPMRALNGQLYLRFLVK